MMIATLLSLLFTPPEGHARAIAPGRGYVADEVLVKFKPHVHENIQNALAARNGSLILNNFKRLGISRVKLLDNQKVEDVVAKFSKEQDVEFAQPNFIYRASLVPNDTKYGQLWGLRNTGQTIVGAGGPDSPSATHNPGTAGKDMGLEQAWNYITDCSSVVVAVVDTGVNYNHNDLASNMWVDAGFPNHGYNYIANTNDPMDDHGHGTHVAGTIGAVGNNATGTTGVCWKVQLMAVKALDSSGAGTTLQVAQGITFAVDHGAKVINLSLAGSGNDAALSNAVTAAKDGGAVLVTAAGNEGSDNDANPAYPCSYTHSNILCVAALDQSYNLAGFSNYGARSVDVAAPGVNVVSTWPGSVSTTQADMTAGWTMNGGWGTTTVSTTIGNLPVIANPSNYNGATAKYANNANDTSYRTFDTTGAGAVTLYTTLVVDTENTNDVVSIGAKAAGGDPFAGGTVLDSFSGSSSGYLVQLGYDLSSCISATCSVGFNLTTNATTVDYGIAIVSVDIEKLIYNNTTYNVISGTSMATPHVAGLAAMLFAYNPSFTYSDVIRAIKNGGIPLSELSSTTTSGKAVHAMGALSYVAPPSGAKAEAE